MNVRKSWFSYILWAATALFALLTFIPLSDRIIVNDYNSIYIAAIIKIVFFVLPIIISFAIYLIFKNRNMYFNPAKKAKIILHTVSILIVMSCFLAFRYYELKIANTQLLNEELFEQIKIGSDFHLNGYAATINEGFYDYIASFALLIFGNKIGILLYLQLILQLITTIAIYVAASNFFKPVFSMIPAVFLCFNPYYLGNMFNLDSSNYKLMIYAFLLMIISFVIKNGNYLILKSVIVSIVTGVLMFYHLNLFALLLLFVLLICECDDLNIQNKFINSILSLLIAFISFGVTYVLHYLGNFDIFISLLKEIQLKSIDYGSQYAVTYQFILLLCFMSYIFSFWLSGNIKGHNFIVPLVLNGVCFIFIKQFSSLSETFIISNIMMTMIIAESFCLIFNCMNEFNSKSRVNITLPKNNKNKNASKVSNSSVIQKTGEQITDTAIKNVVVNPAQAKTQNSIESTADSWTEMQKNIEEERKVRKRNTVNVDKKAPIENVLPMPKKHVKKTLDYKYELNEKDMHFDLDLNENNSDYDV